MKQILHQKFAGKKYCFKQMLTGIFILAFIFGFNFSAKACSPLAVPVLLNQSLSGSNLLLDWQSVNQWSCPGYSVQVEIACLNSNFDGLAPLYMSPALNKTVQPQPYPEQTIDISNLCPGTVYQFRAREVEAGAFVFSGWTSTFTFTTPGTFVPPTLNVTASNNIICPPQVTQLNAAVVNGCGGGPYTYTWTPSTGLSNPNVANPTATVNTSTIYSVTVGGGKLGCWTVGGSVNISTSLAPPVGGQGIAVPAVVCVNLPTMLVLSNFTGNIQWQSGPSGGPYTNIPGAVTNSYVTGPLSGNLCFQAIVSSCTGSTTSSPFCVTVNQTPVLAPTVVQSNCTNTVATANIGNPGSSGSPNSATWTPTPISLSSQSTVGTYSVPGVVTITVSFPDGCVSHTSLTINPAPPMPTFTINNLTGSTTLTCTYPTIDLTAANNYTFGTPTYYWSSASFTAATQSVTIVNPGTYSVIVTDPATNCVVIHTVAITLNMTVPSSSVNPVSQTIGCGPGVVATATGSAISPSINVTHYWYFPGSPIPYVTGGPISIVQPIIGTNTFVLVNDINGCSVTKTVEVISNGGTYPTFDLTSVTNFTLGCGTNSLSAITITNGQVPPNGGAVSYTVLTPSFTGPSYGFTSNITYTLNSPGIYTVIVKSNNNACETRLPVSIIQNTFAPNVGYTASTQTLDCITSSVTLIGTSTDTAPVTYLWKSNGNPNTTVGYSLTVNTTTAGASVPSGTVVDHYTLTVTDQNNACTNTMVVTVYQNTRPPLALIGGSSTLTCLYTNVNLSNISSTGILPGTFSTAQPIIGLLWEGPTPQLPKPNSSSYSGVTPGIYTLTARDENNGCTSKTTTPVYDGKNYPVINVPRTYTLDCGNSSTTLTAVFIPSTGLTYKWNVVPNAVVGTLTTGVLLTNSPGEYQIVATNPLNGCASYSLVDVVNGALAGGFDADKTSGFAPLTVNFTNNSTSSSTLSGTSSVTAVWSFGNGATKTTTNNNVPISEVYAEAGTYTVTMFVAKGSCLDTVTKIITVDIPSKLEIPNIFTPNGDNSNDVFFLKTANLTNITALIYDRWGNKVYELSTDKGNIAWDGKNQSGKEVANGTYFYVIKATGKDGESYDAKGNVSLYR